MLFQRNSKNPYVLPPGYTISGQLLSDARSVLKGYNSPYSQVAGGNVGSGRLPWAYLFADDNDGPVLYSSFIGISDTLGRMGKFAWKSTGPFGIISESADDFVYIIDSAGAADSEGTRDTLVEAIQAAQALTDWFITATVLPGGNSPAAMPITSAMRTNLGIIDTPDTDFYGMIIMATIPGAMPAIGFETAGVVSELEITGPGTYVYTPHGVLIYGDPEALISEGDNFSYFGSDPDISSDLWIDPGSDSNTTLPGMFGQNFAFLPTDEAQSSEYY